MTMHDLFQLDQNIRLKHFDKIYSDAEALFIVKELAEELNKKSVPALITQFEVMLDNFVINSESGKVYFVTTDVQDHWVHKVETLS